MKIGIPRALLYYKYKCLWVMFFKKLGHEVILSPESNRQILKRGEALAIDEACLPLKLYLGAIDWLKDKCDYVLVPRIKNFARKESACVIFNGIYDIVNNCIDVPILDYDIDYKSGHNEMNGLVEIGKRLGENTNKCLNAYLKAKSCQNKYNRLVLNNQIMSLTNDGIKILVASHAYNTYDNMIGVPAVKYLKSLGVSIVYADVYEEKEAYEKSKQITSTLYWTFNKNLVGAIALLKDKVDGIILVSSFPCGPDSLVNELLIRKIKDKPVLNLVLDSQESDTGLKTRLESFIDILSMKKSGETAV